MGVIDDITKSFSPEEDEKKTDIIEPVDYKNGVLYFDCTGEQFTTSLSAWLGKNKKLYVDAIAPHYSSGGLNAGLKGYIVVVS
ncbi:MAG: hypothetical protein PHX61_02285 [Alphaproteobacteria bacterium]|nr:hypothetical protein [Alphaproteobacteria bacterium]